MRHRLFLAPLAIAVTCLLGGMTVSTASAAPKPKVSYCSPTGDYCQGIFRQNGRLRANISTFSFSGDYQLCVINRTHGRQCNTLQLRRGCSGIFQGSVGLAKHFRFQAKGRYSVIWRLDSHTIGKKLSFRKG